MLDRKRVSRGCVILFRRSGETTDATGPFDLLPESLRGLLARDAHLDANEMPVVASVLSDGVWLLITTDRVVFKSEEGVISLSLSEVRDVYSASLENANDKREDVLVLVTDSTKYDVRVEPGRALSGIWNVLRRLRILWIDEARTGGSSPAQR